MDNIKESLEEVIDQLNNIKNSIDCKIDSTKYCSMVKIALISILKEKGAQYDDMLKYEDVKTEKKFFAKKISNVNDLSEMLDVINSCYSVIKENLENSDIQKLQNISFNFPAIELLKGLDSSCNLLRGKLLYRKD